VTLSFAVLGDSIAFGQGASRASDTVGARLAAGLAAGDIATDVRVFAVSGARSEALGRQTQLATAWRPDLALIIIGANDLTHFVPPQQAGAYLAEAVRSLRVAGAEVVVAPAPDLSVVPWVPPQMRMAVRAGSKLLQDEQSRVALAEGARVAAIGVGPAAGFQVDPGLFSADRFHPSSAGYAVIAESLAPTVREAAVAALARRR
jgi:lysophospholipase L1-like esterase